MLALKGCASVVCLTVLSATFVAADESTPQERVVASKPASVYSGPGDNHYVTGELPAGTSVEVHRRSPRGWLAIRPPVGSFSWVSAEHLRTNQEETLAEVVDAEVVSWIGREGESDLDHRWQVTLRENEVLEILGNAHVSLATGQPAAEYVKIAPPSGEFRWIRERDLVGSSTEPTTPSVHLAEFQVVIEDEPAEPRRDGFVARRPRRAGTEIDRPVRSPSRSLPTRGNVTGSSLRERRESPPPAAASAAVSSVDVTLKDLDLQLSQMVTRPAETWELEPLRSQIESIGANADDTVQRGRARVLLEKIAEFEDLHQRYASLAADTTGATGVAPAEGARSLVDPRFDGTGWLLPVHSSKRESPPYALLDSDGNILQFVSPAPGLNLHRYIRKEVGIFGQKQFAPTLQRQHLTAHRIVDLARHR